MNIILLTGKENFGKTSSLKFLYEEHLKILKPIEFTVEGADKKDFSTVFNYNGKTIAIYSIGDEAQYVKFAFEKYSSFKIDGAEIKIDILILSHRTKIQLPKGIPIASKLPEYPKTLNVVDYPNIELITKIVKKGSTVLDKNNMTDKEKIDCIELNNECSINLIKITDKLLTANI